MYFAEYNNIDDGTFTTDDRTNENDNSANRANSSNVDDDDDDEDDDEDMSTSYTLTTGNDGLILIDQMTDYINRGQGLKYMSLWEYRSKVYKKKFSAQELKKHHSNRFS